MIVSVADGVPVVYPGCHGVGVRVVHPANDKAPAANMGLVLFYVPPHVVLEPGSHPTEETYVVLEGEGLMTFAGSQRQVSKGDFIYLPPWCEHGGGEHGARNARHSDLHLAAQPVMVARRRSPSAANLLEPANATRQRREKAP